MPRHTSNLKRLLWCSFSILSFASSAAFAQNASTADVDSSEIVVTAQKRAQSINDVGLSITAITGDQLIKSGVTDTSQLTRVVPGFVYNETAQASPVYTIRGIGYQDTSIASSPAVTVYVDEVPIPYSGGTLGAALDLERVEVLKGPQGTLFGANSTGGAINYIAAKPTDEFAAGFNLSYGRFNTFDATGYVGGPIADGLNVRLSGRLLQSNDWQRSYTRNDTLGEADQLMGRLLVDWTPNERLKISINVNGWRDKSETPAPQLIEKGFPSLAAPLHPNFVAQPLSPEEPRAADWTPGLDYKRNNRYWQASGRIDFEATDSLTITSITSYQEFRRHTPIDLDGAVSNNLFYLSMGTVKTFFQELRASLQFGSNGNAMLGANYQSDKIKEDTFVTFDESTNAAIGTIVTDLKQKARNKSIFGNIEYEFLPGLSFVGGIRYSEADRDFEGCSRDTGDGIAAGFFNFLFNSGAVPGGCATINRAGVSGLTVEELREDNISWRAGLNFKPSGDVLIYGTASKGYKSGAFQSLGAVTFNSFIPVVQESVMAYEVGFKAGLFNRKLQLNAAAFYYDYRNKQIRGIVIDPIIGPYEALINVPKSRIWGFEASATIRPVDGLTISPSITLVDSKVQSNLVTPSPDIDLINAQGEAFPYTPRWSGNTDIEYRWPVSGGMDAFVGGNVTYRTSTNGGFGEDPDFKVIGYTLLDLRAGVESSDGTWNASIWGRNVTNKYYWSTATRASDAGTRLAGMPVTYGVSVGYRF